MVFVATRHIIKLYYHRRCKIKKPNGARHCYTQRNGRTRFLYYACVSGRKVPFATSGWPDPPQRKRSKIQPNGKCDRNGPLTVRYLSPDGRPRADTFWKVKRRRSSQASTHSLP